MQVIHAGDQKYILLELESEVLSNVARQAGFDVQVEDRTRTWALELTANGRKAPLLLFDAADPGNLGWFSRCQFYVDGQTGAVLQTPLRMANRTDRSGHVLRDSVKVQLAKELPASFRLPGRQPVTEQLIYALLYNFLNALQNTGVGLCGGPVVRPLAGRTEALPPHN